MPFPVEFIDFYLEQFIFLLIIIIDNSDLDLMG